MDYTRYDAPRRPPSGLSDIYCRKCGRLIARTPQAQFRTVSKCAICVLHEQGVKNPEDYVLAQYIQTDPTKPPVPLNAESPEFMYEIFPDERPQEGEQPKQTGVMGTIQSIFRVIGFGKQIAEKKKAEPLPKSRRIAEERKKTTLFD